MFLALRKFDLKEDLGFNHGGIYKKFEIIPGFRLYITEINSKHQSSFFFSLEVDVIGYIKEVEKFQLVSLVFGNNWIYREVELLQHVNMKHNDNFIDM